MTGNNFSVAGLIKLWCRCWRHLGHDEQSLRRKLNASALDRLEQQVQQSEREHGGEIRLCIETALAWPLIWRNTPPRHRALTLFSELRVWDTEQNNGVLIYLLLAEHAIEIVADRGLAKHVTQESWQSVLTPLQNALRHNQFEDGLGQAIAAVTQLLRAHFPAAATPEFPNELSDRPYVI